MAEPDTGETLYDLPSPYLPHPCGLLHLPRFLAKIRKSLEGELPESYRRNFTKGFDAFLCLHLGVEPGEIIETVRTSKNEETLDAKLIEIFPKDLKVHQWNRKLVQMGMKATGKEKLEEIKKEMGLCNRKDLLSFADMIEFDEGRLD